MVVELILEVVHWEELNMYLIEHYNIHKKENNLVKN